MVNRVLSDAKDGPLQAANYNGAFVLEPKIEDFSELKFISANIFNPELTYQRTNEEDTGLPHVVLQNPVPSKDKASIEIQNGTFVSGFGAPRKKNCSALVILCLQFQATTQDYPKPSSTISAMASSLPPLISSPAIIRTISRTRSRWASAHQLTFLSFSAWTPPTKYSYVLPHQKRRAKPCPHRANECR